jgi:hypothetical protein
MPGSGSRPTLIHTIGAILFLYGLAAALLVEFLSLVGLQGAREDMLIWPGFVFTPVIPALVALSGRSLMRGSSWGHGVALLLPLLIVPLALWSLDGPGRAETLGAAVLQTLAVGAVLSLLSVPFSLALLFIWIRNLIPGLRRG